MKRVVVTGVGPVTPIGVGADAFLDAQQRAANGIRGITSFDASDLTVRIGGEVDVDVSAYIERKQAKRLDRFVHFALIASELAVADAGLSAD
jgi:3-oxoacyl-[acyl-carrier-protein] synthase II